MKEVNKSILDNNVVISVENIQKMGEVIALTCIKTVIVRSGKDLHYLYKGLLRDMNRSKEDNSPFSNAYDSRVDRGNEKKGLFRLTASKPSGAAKPRKGVLNG